MPGPATAAPSWCRRAAACGAAALALLLLHRTSRENYLLFHGIVELVGVAVAWGVFLLVWNARRSVAHDAFAFLGLSLFAAGWLDLLHALAYKGMGVLAAAHDANAATQLWIAARVLATSGFIVFPLLLGRRVRLALLAAGYGGAVVLAAVSILVWGTFPDCFVEGRGLTPFKRAAECAVCMALALGLSLLWQRRDRFEPGVFRGLAGVFIVTIASEVCFTLYADVYGVLSFAGHILRLLAAYLLYRSLIHASLILPYATLFRELDQEHRELRTAEAELRQSEERYRLAVESSSSAVWEWDVPRQQVNYSPRWYALRGRSPGTSWQPEAQWSDGIHPADRERVLEAVRAHFGGASAVLKEEYRVLHADGHWIWIRDCGIAQRDGGGQVVRMVGWEEDISGRKQAEDAVRASETLFRNLFDLHAAVKLLIDPATGAIVDVNRAAVAYYGWSRDEMRSMRIQDINTLSPDEVAGEMQKAKETSRNYFEFRHRRADGSVRDVAVFSSNVAQMDRPLLHSIIHDITEQKRLQDSLLQQLQLVQAILDVTPGFLVLKDRNSIYREVNPAFCRFLGRPREAIIGRSDDQLFPPDEAAAYRSGDVTVMETGLAESRDWLVTGSHEKRWLHVTKSAVRGEDDTVTGVLCSVEDITQRKRAEIALRENASMLAKSQEIGHIGSWELELPSNRLTWSDEVYRILGCQPQEFDASYQSLLAFVHPDDRAAVTDAYASSLQDGSDAYEMEHRIVRPGTGEVRRVRERCIHERDPAGAIVRSIGMVQDITERKLVEDAQRFMAQCGLPVGGEDFFVSLVRYLATALAVDYVSIGRLLGAASVESLATWDNGAPASTGCRALAGSPCGLAMEAGVHHCPAGARQAFPRYEPVQALGAESLYAIRLSDTRGEPIGFICLAARSPMPDPVPAQLVLGVAAPRAAAEMERRRQEGVAEENHKRLISIIDAMPDPVYVSDPSTHELLFVNDALRSVLGEPAGRTCHEYLQGRDAPCPFCTNYKLFGASFGQPVEWEFQNLRNNRWYRVVDRGITWPDGRHVRLEIAMDMTEVKQAESALRQSLMEKTALLKEVHHRVKNNLQVVASLLSLQERRQQMPEAQDVLHDTQARVTAMALLHEVLYRSENLATVDVAVYVERLCASLLRTVGSVATRVQVVRDIAPVELPLEQAVPCGLIINELVANALKHGYLDGRHGKVRIEIKIEGRMVLMRVTDDGAGLPHALDIDKLPTLGLRLVQDLARQLRGVCRVARRPDEVGGTEVNVDFPVADKQDVGGSP